MTTPNDLPSVGTEDARQKFDKAWRVVASLSDGTQDWTMSVPARPDSDPDLVISDALRCARALVSERDEMASRVSELEAEVLDQCRLNGMGAERESALMGRVRKLESAALAAQPGAVGEDALIEVIRERDERDRVIDAILDLVLGNDRPEWSSAYGFHDAVNDVDEHMASLAAAPTEAKPAQDAVDAEQTIAALRAEIEQLRRDMGAMVREDVDCALAAATQDALQPAANWLLSNVEHCDAGELAHRLVISPEYAIRLERAAISAKKGGAA